MNQTPTSNQKNLFSWLYSLWKFSRPHTIVGTTLSVVALYLLAILTTNTSITLVTLGYGSGALLACLCANVYIVGLNQLEDLEIDEVNKPHLPLAAKEFSLREGKLIIAITGIVSLVLAACQGIWLLTTVTLSLLIGTAYSSPPIRLKRFPLFAALCIFTVRGAIVNLGLFLHFQRQFSAETFLPATVWTLAGFIIIFSVAIAIFKDVPDMEGDKQYQVNTFTLLVGKQAVFRFARGIITFSYLSIIVAAIFWLTRVNLPFFVVAHSLLLILLWWRSQKVDLDNKPAIASFYQFIWRLFFLEYLLFPAACFLA